MQGPQTTGTRCQVLGGPEPWGAGSGEGHSRVPPPPTSLCCPSHCALEERVSTAALLWALG